MISRQPQIPVVDLSAAFGESHVNFTRILSVKTHYTKRSALNCIWWYLTESDVFEKGWSSLPSLRHCLKYTDPDTESIKSAPKREALFYWINSAEKEIPLPLWAQRAYQKRQCDKSLSASDAEAGQKSWGSGGFYHCKSLIWHLSRGQAWGDNWNGLLSVSPPASPFTLS